MTCICDRVYLPEKLATGIHHLVSEISVVCDRLLSVSVNEDSGSNLKASANTQSFKMDNSFIVANRPLFLTHFVKNVHFVACSACCICLMYFVEICVSISVG